MGGAASAWGVERATASSVGGARGDPGGPRRDINWRAPGGTEKAAEDWADEERRVFGMQIGNDDPAHDRVLVLVNGSDAERAFRLSPVIGGPSRPAFDTSVPDGSPAAAAPIEEGTDVALPPRCVAVFLGEP